ncbi:sugar porter family MFS transporter [Rapidithrix thailandica]|uniref:Sugar porter family MFS transporter n=1 Tax=Rapidithrix thailandica TaxID=413964 RepID=A0AAW9SDN9_9BACT
MKTSSNILYLSAVTLIATLGGFLFGFDTAVISGTIGFLKNQFALDAVMEGWVVSSALLGCIIGAAFAGYLSDKYGRKLTLIVSAALFFVSAIFSALPEQLEVLIIARWAGGVAVGIASMLSPLYISEFSPRHLRGRMVALYQFAITVGILSAYFSNAFLLKYAAGDGFEAGSLVSWLFHEEVWRGMFMTEAIPALLFLVLLFTVPKSPRWLLRMGQREEAFAILTKVNGREEAEREVKEIETSLKQEQDAHVSVMSPQFRVAMLIGIVLALASQLSGINAIIYYGPKIFKEAGFTLGDAFGGQVTVGVVNVLFTTVAIWKIDQLGRKPLLLAGMFGTLFSLITVGILFQMQITTGYFLIAMLLFFIACFAFSYGPVVWVIASEIFPTRIRGRAMSIATLCVWVGAALVSQTFPWLLETFGPQGAFWLFAAITFPVVWFVIKFVPETKGKSLEEIEAHWMQKDGATPKEKHLEIKS